ncbi:unnamed protein product [Lepeophtheirus salmonis]|uniref:(salmon louse) hypothetical protein n=1 Tax=Lepeophtheirus salmonis TaxID=72036 RepID=A0A7R8H2E9_LEPSM|nr:unnamed protein product [Lepeophtheirus salmonis]CAF2812614.1 unnamed protein product [Lepeophtheirus salmonis]
MLKYPNLLWPNPTIPYQLKDNGSVIHVQILEAMNAISDQTCLMEKSTMHARILMLQNPGVQLALINRPKKVISRGDCEPGCFENGKSNNVKQSCGSSKVGDLKKAKYGDHPWHVYVQEKNKDDFLCQGVLLTPIHVLTSAVCVVNRCFLKVSVGCVNIGDSNEKCQSRDVIRITPHFEYDNMTLANNLAITTASNSFKLNDGVIPVSIPFIVKMNRSPQSATLTGVKDNDLMSEVLNIVTKSPECTSQETICTIGTGFLQGIHVGSPLIGYDNGFCTLIGIRMKQIGNHTTYTKIFTLSKLDKTEYTICI